MRSRLLHPIEQEVLERCRVEVFAIDTEAEYRIKLVVATTRLPDEEFEQFSPRTKDWLNAAIEAFNDGRRIPDFGPIEFEEESPGDVVPRTRSGESQSRNYWQHYRSASERAREILIEQGLQMTTSQIFSQLKVEGYTTTASTVTLVRSEFRRAVLTLYRAGYLTEDLKGMGSLIVGKPHTFP